MFNRTIGGVYRHARRYARRVVRRIPGGSGLLAWTDPLHVACLLIEEAVRARVGYAHGRLLDVGCGYQPYRNLFTQVDTYIGIDFPPNGRVEVHGDALELPFAATTFDTVLCNEVLEHVYDPSRLINEVERVLRPGGVLILTTPQTWGLHHEPHDYYRYTKYGLRYLAEKSNLQVLEVEPTCGLWATFAQRIADTVIYTYAVGQASWVIDLLSAVLAPMLFVGYKLDRIIGARGDTLDNVLVARKPIILDS